MSNSVERNALAGSSAQAACGADSPGRGTHSFVHYETESPRIAANPATGKRYRGKYLLKVSMVFLAAVAESGIGNASAQA